jgi:hypothetical protein
VGASTVTTAAAAATATRQRWRWTQTTNNNQLNAAAEDSAAEIRLLTAKPMAYFEVDE